MIAEESRLKWALEAHAGNPESIISMETARAAVLDGLGIMEQDFSVRAFGPENFLFTFHSQAVRDRTIGAGSVLAGYTSGNGRGWSAHNPSPCSTRLCWRSMEFHLVAPVFGLPAARLLLLDRATGSGDGEQNRHVGIPPHSLDRQAK